MKIVAIGGGEIGRPGYPIETEEIDLEIIRLTGKKNPKLLFLPTASSDSEGYVEVVQNYFGKRLGCNVSSLLLLNNKYTQKQLEEAILSTDIVYVGGGNTLKMMKAWRKLGVDKLLKKAGEKGVVLSGVSAGAICWFKYGCSDSIKFNNPQADYIRVSGLGFINATFCPHFDFQKDRLKAMEKIMSKTNGIGIALDNCAALEIVDDKFKILTTKDSAKAYKAFVKNGQYLLTEVEKSDLQPFPSNYS
jgi:dipeptidase E